MPTNNVTREVEDYLGGPCKNADYLARYIGARMPGQRQPNEQSRLVFWGHQVGIQRQVAKKIFSFSSLPLHRQWEKWLRIWRESSVYDVKSVAIIWISQPKLKQLRLENWRDVVSMTGQIDNWAHSDSISGMLAEILEQRPALFSAYQRWNASKNPWLRRQSLVGLYYYARLRKKALPAAKTLPLVKNLLRDPHFYVQRGVGWTLREIDRVDCEKQRLFVRKNLKDISPVAWFATSELYPVTMRKKLVALRRL